MHLNKKEFPEQVLSFEFCEIFNDAVFTEHLRTTAFGIPLLSSLTKQY